MTAPEVHRVSGTELLRRAREIRRIYAGAFGAGPGARDGREAGGRDGHDAEGRDGHDADRGDGRDADRYLDRLVGDVRRPGFVAALATDGDAVLGFATGWTTPDALPPDRCYPQAVACLGVERATAWLCGGREVDELAVTGAAQGRNLGSGLLGAVTADAPDGRCWLLTPVRAAAALAFYRHRDWTQVTHPAPGGTGHAVFLGPGHPARTAAPLPL
ncbi:GNAT family N-acetyltransferase [Streptomyces sp. NPDC021093]|uniref:GNAT family N-acetyltransferase n=1 Tax=Streptomyces sp. NPDC021093 TaxID=3365112 RepID=UPI0037B65FCE